MPHLVASRVNRPQCAKWVSYDITVTSPTLTVVLSFEVTMTCPRTQVFRNMWHFNLISWRSHLVRKHPCHLVRLTRWDSQLVAHVPKILEVCDISLWYFGSLTWWGSRWLAHVPTFLGIGDVFVWSCWVLIRWESQRTHFFRTVWYFRVIFLWHHPYRIQWPLYSRSLRELPII